MTGGALLTKAFSVRFFKTQGEKNSSPEKTQDSFGAKTQRTGAFPPMSSQNST